MRMLGVMGLLAATIISCGSRADMPAWDADASVTNPNPNPGCIYEVYRHQPDGWVLSSPTLHFVFWGTYWQVNSDEEQRYVASWTYLINGPGDVLKRLSEYGVHGATMSNFPANANLQVKPVQLDDTTFDAELTNEIASSDVAVPDNNALYVVFLPPKTTTDKLVHNKWNGYHASSNYGDIPFAYAIIEYNTDWITTNGVVSHEIYEATTNPSGQGYYDNVHGEVGDLCQFFDTTAIDGITVQKVWSEAACRCL